MNPKKFVVYPRSLRPLRGLEPDRLSVWTEVLVPSNVLSVTFTRPGPELPVVWRYQHSDGILPNDPHATIPSWYPNSMAILDCVLMAQHLMFPTEYRRSPAWFHSKTHTDPPRLKAVWVVGDTLTIMDDHDQMLEFCAHPGVFESLRASLAGIHQTSS